MTKPARLLQIVTLLGGRRSRSVRELADRFETTERTIFRDLADLEALGLPVTRDEYGYRFPEGATLRPLTLDLEERAVLSVALANPALRKTGAIARRLERLAAKLAAVAKPSEETAVVLAEVDRSGPIQPGVIEALERAIARPQPVEMDYASLRSGRRARRGVDPLALFHRAEAWYLAARCHRHDEVRVFRLDRIGAVRELPGTFAKPAGFSVEEFLADAWSLHHGAPKYEVVIHFDESLAALIANARHHEGERVERLPDGALDYRVKLADLEEIARWIAGFGGKAVAIEPQELVGRVRSLAEGVVEVHPARRLRAVARVTARPSPRPQAKKKIGRH